MELALWIARLELVEEVIQRQVRPQVGTLLVYVFFVFFLLGHGLAGSAVTVAASGGAWG